MSIASNPYYDLVLHQSRYLVKLLSELRSVTGSIYRPRVEIPPMSAPSHQRPKASLEIALSQKAPEDADALLADNLRLNINLVLLQLAYLLMEAHRCGFSLCVGLPLTDSGVLLVGEANEPKIFTVDRI